MVFQCEDSIISDNEKALVNEEADLIILDDFFPNPLSAFRFQEYITYLDSFQEVIIYSTSDYFDREELMEDLENEYPKLKKKVRRFSPYSILNAKLIYTIFLNNIYFYLDVIEKNKIPFLFTLYPGGGFFIKDSAESDEKLRRVMGSPYFRKVIVTQPITYDYLVDNNFCKPDQIEKIYGGVADLSITKKYCDKKFFGKDKSVLDVCFVACKYMEKGLDKGYDLFIAAAKRLSANDDNIIFHVVGGFSAADIDVSELGDKIKFYGYKLSKWFYDFYKDKDILIAPSIPFIRSGEFDGFPTGCALDASLHRVAIFCTDILKLNVQYKDEKEIVIIPPNVDGIVELVEKHYNSPRKLQKIADNGYKKSRKFFSFKNQLAPRIKTISRLISDG